MFGRSHEAKRASLPSLGPVGAGMALYPMSAIESDGLTKRFRRLHSYRDLVLYPWRHESHLAVDGVSLQINGGEIFGLLGENGAGKSTLIRMLSTTLLPTSGSATVGGHDVVAEPHRVRQLIGVVTGAERSFYWRLSGRQNLEFFAALYHIPRPVARRRIDELLAVIGIDEYARQPFQSYSTGTRHKFDIARGLLNAPQILFLDEPTRSLDPIATIEVRKIISDYIVGELGRTVLFATHSLTEAEAMCDRVAIIRGGRLVQTGTVAELRGALELGISCVITVDGTVTSLRDEISRIPGVHDVAVSTGEASSELTVRIDNHDPDLLNELLAAVLESGTRVRSWITHEPTLEEIYRRVLGADPAPTGPVSEQS